MSKFLKVDTSNIPSQPILDDDQELEELFGDPRLRKVILKGFLKLQNDIIDLKNIVEQPPTPTPHRTLKQVRSWFITNLKGV